MSNFSLVFSVYDARFAGEKKNLSLMEEKDVRRLQSAYEMFGRLMLDEKIYLKKGMTFGCVCRIIGVSPEDLDEVVTREMGMSGQSLMDAYRISSKRGRVVTSE